MQRGQSTLVGGLLHSRRGLPGSGLARRGASILHHIVFSAGWAENQLVSFRHGTNFGEASLSFWGDLDKWQ